MATAITPAIILVGPADDGRRVTAEEYRRIEVQSGYQCELARGVLEVTQIPDENHALLVCFFYDALSVYRRANPGLIHLYGGSNEFHFWLPEMLSGRNPDVAVSLRGAPKDELGHSVASLAIEVVSPGKQAHERDYITKREEYLVYGLREYWIVDRFSRTVLVLVRDHNAWSKRVLAEGETAESLVLPEFAVVVDDLWTAIAGAPIDAQEPQA